MTHLPTYDVVFSATSLAKSPKIEDFSRLTGYSERLDGADLILVTESEGETVGVLRVCQEDGLWVLRGKRVIESRRRQGLGSALLREAVRRLGRPTCCCIPHARFEGFYASAGFTRLPVGAAPRFLQGRWHDYGRRGLEVIIMPRGPSCN